MPGADALPVVALGQLIVLGLWVGVVATEAVIEIAPFRRPGTTPGPTIFASL